MSRQNIAEELHKPARRNYERRKVQVFGLRDLYQADLVEMIPYARANKGFKYMLTVIDCYSKFAWAVPVKTKNASDVTNAMKTVFQDKGAPDNLQTDQGREFYNPKFGKLMKQHNVNHYSTHSGIKASIAERFNRTLKNQMWKKFSSQGNYKWLTMLPRLVSTYNNKVHRTINMKPVEVVDDSLLQTVYKIEKKLDTHKAKAEVGDYVRISRAKGAFAKGYTPNWSNEIFKVAKIRHYEPRTYYLEDMDGKPIRGGFYGQEIQVTKYPHTYLVEKILKRKGNKVLVRWLGFDSKHDSWIPKSNVTDK